VTFPKIYQRKFSSVNNVSVMIDVSIATVYSGVSFDYFVFFQSFFFICFPPRLSEQDNPLLLCACFDQLCFLEQIH